MMRLSNVCPLRAARSVAFAALAVGGTWAVGCTGKAIEVNEAFPELGVSPTSIDFGEVTVGFKSTIGVTVSNTGYGTLDFAEVVLDGLTSTEFVIEQAPDSGLGAGDPSLLYVSYTPTAQGEDIGTVELRSTDPDHVPDYLLPLTASGVEPEIDLNPESLAFGIVAPATVSDPQSVTACAVGSGDLVIQEIVVTGDGAPYYRFTAPDDYVAPYTLSNGQCIQLVVTFMPLDELQQDANIQIATNSQDALGIVRLSGNVADDPFTNTPPEVQITGPNNGEFFVDNVPAGLTGHVVDPDDDVTTLICQWSADGIPLSGALGYPDVDGNISATSNLPSGDITVKLECFDAARDSGEDSVVLTVWPHDEPMQYVISGGPTEFDYIGVDDDLTIYLNGTQIYADSDHTKTNLPPIAFDAVIGDELRIVVTDAKETEAAVDALQLHWGTGSSQELNDSLCLSSAPANACYDGTYAGPWPTVVLDEAYTISIP